MKKTYLIFVLLCIYTSAFAVEFTVTGIKYSTTSSNTVQVIRNGKHNGDIVIPNSVSYKNIEYSVTSIGYSAFSGCSGLTSVTIPNSVTSIDYRAFSGCNRLTSLTILCPTVGSWFSGMTSIKELTLGEGVTSIGSEAFRGCSGLTFVTIPNSVTSIGASAFSGCRGLTSVTIPNSVTSIGIYAFYGCSGLTSVTIGNSVTSIADYAFSGCSGLTSVISLNTTPPQISANTFDSDTYANASLKVPNGCKTIYWLHPYWENFYNMEEIDVTKVESIPSEEKDIIKNGYVHNLKGERINVDKSNFDNLTKGVYIVNGKKVIIR